MPDRLAELWNQWDNQMTTLLTGDRTIYPDMKETMSEIVTHQSRIAKATSHVGAVYKQTARSR